MNSVSVVIPTYNGLSLLQKNLPSVLKNLRNGDEVLIIDDASTDQTLEWLSSTFQLQSVVSESDTYSVWQANLSQPNQLTLKVVKNHTNLRFGASCNRAVTLATSNLILLINNDVALYPTTISHLLPHFVDHQVFAVGCHEIEHNQASISGGKNKLWFEKGLFWHNRADNFETGETAWASGGSAMFDREKWLELGGFDPVFYPAYWEDVDLSFRARKKGWRVLFEAKAKVDHNHETTNTNVFGQQKIAAMSRRHALVFAWRHTTLFQKIQFLFWLPRYLIVK